MRDITSSSIFVVNKPLTLDSLLLVKWTLNAPIGQAKDLQRGLAEKLREKEREAIVEAVIEAA